MDGSVKPPPVADVILVLDGLQRDMEAGEWRSERKWMVVREKEKG
jgi:hypothetical protein